MGELRLPIQGMRCDHCVQQVTRALESVPEVESADVSLANKVAVVRGPLVPSRGDEANGATGDHEQSPLNSQAIDSVESRLARAVSEAGFQVEPGFQVEGGFQVEAGEGEEPREPDVDRKPDAFVEPSALVPLHVGVESGDASTPPRPSASRSGFEAAGQRLSFDVEGMHCASCVNNVESALKSSPGVRKAWVNLATQQATVETDEGVDVGRLMAAVADAGYQAHEAAPAEQAAESMSNRLQRERRGWLIRFVVALASLGLLMAVAHWQALATQRALLVWLVATFMQAYVGWPYLVGAIARLRHGSANMDTLVVLGTGAAYLAGIWGILGDGQSMAFMDAAMILTFITLGKFLETLARGRASAAIQRLLDLSAPEATVERDGVLQTVPVSQARVHDVLVVRPGEKIPLDAVVRDGASFVDQSWLTGESLPIRKQLGDPVFAGTLNGDGSLRAEVVRVSGETMLAQTIDLVRRAQESKADVQRLADSVIAWFVPVIILVAVVTMIGWTLASEPAFGLRSAIAVLVVACPCALGLATPTAMLVATGRGAEDGILIKNAQALELAGRVTSVVLDKTGTITAGRADVVELVPREPHTEEALLQAAANVEQLSRHPLADAVRRCAAERGLTPQAAEQLQVLPGLGIEAQSDGSTMLVGNENLMQQRGIVTPRGLADVLQQESRRGRTAFLVARDDDLMGAIVVADSIPEGSRHAINSLHELGLRVVMLSGDHQQTAEAVAADVGIDEVYAEVRPDQKLEYVEKLQARGEVVAMVGDGVNDSPALAAADLGVAIGSGADVAVESADVVLVRSQLELVPRALVLAHQTRQTIWQNLGWAFVYNLTLVPLAAGVLAPFGISLPPAWAAAAMAASSVSVVANSLRLRLRRRTPRGGSLESRSG